jgi:hypothetical protein
VAQPAGALLKAKLSGGEFCRGEFRGSTIGPATHDPGHTSGFLYETDVLKDQRRQSRIAGS